MIKQTLLEIMAEHRDEIPNHPEIFEVFDNLPNLNKNTLVETRCPSCHGDACSFGAEIKDELEALISANSISEIATIFGKRGIYVNGRRMKGQHTHAIDTKTGKAIDAPEISADQNIKP
ncbi:hypothetical protein [Magnetococcus sp. PR-3]|uniref:hypothetical protein n=1 Tax=Magnetococcus sp. PR-3 TaxID=3120355 RepID=UPI002FCDEC59